MKCLVVDDSATMRRIVVNALKSIGYDDVVEAGDGSDALQKCDASVELVITDWNMPVMGGLDFVKALRANPQHGKTPILMVTTRSVKEDIIQAVNPYWEVMQVNTRREHYQKTTGEWLRRLRLNEKTIREKWGDKVFDDYDRYLSTCVRAFDQHYSSLAQYELRRID